MTYLFKAIFSPVDRDSKKKEWFLYTLGKASALPFIWPNCIRKLSNVIFSLY